MISVLAAFNHILVPKYYTDYLSAISSGCIILRKCVRLLQLNVVNSFLCLPIILVNGDNFELL